MQGLIDLIKTLLDGLDLRRRWMVVAGIILLAFFLLFAFEYWTGWNYYRNVEKTVSLLERLHTLSEDGISQDSDLYPIYKRVVDDLLTFAF